MRIALIGFGEVGQTLAEDLRGHQLSAYDILFSDRESGPVRTLGPLGVREGRDAPDAVAGAELVISAVTAAQDLAAAGSVGPGLAKGAFFLDLNSCSPAQKVASADAVGGAGGRYVEAAVMAPIGPRRIASPMLLGGPHAADARPILEELGFAGASVFSDVVGRAAATKLCRSVMIKGVEALVTESMLAARYYGVEDVVLASLSDLLPLPDWPKTAQYMVARSLEHGTRRAEEMREAARTVAEAGVDPTMSEAIAQRQDWAAAHRDALKTPALGEMLDAVLVERRGRD